MQSLYSTITVFLILAFPVAGFAQPLTDHHIHLRSKAVTEAGEKWQEATDYNSDPAEGRHWKRDALLEEMDKVGIDQAILLSFAYMFAAPELTYEDERERVQDENDWIASQAADSDRLVAFCGLPPLADYASDEVDRCAEKPSVRGIKLHLFNSDVDLTDEAQRQAVANLIGLADEQGLYTVIHSQTRSPDYGVSQLIRFIEDLAPKIEQTAVLLAHLGLNPPLTGKQLTQMDTLAKALETLDPKGERFFFDTSYVVVPPSLVDSDVEAFVREANPRAGEAFRTLGLHRIVFGSDSNSPNQMQAHLKAFRQKSGLSEEEVEAVLSNQLPIFYEED